MEEQAASEALVVSCHSLSQKVATYAKKLIGESDAFAEEIKSMEAQLAEAEKAAKDIDDESERSYVQQQLRHARKIIGGLGPGGDLRRMCKPRNPALLRFLLGARTPVVTIRQDQCTAMKEEYHRFRDRSVWVMIVGPLLLMAGMRRADALRSKSEQYTLTPALMTGWQLYLAWLTYFYCAMALRENVLLVNGSNIRSWWIRHHYWSTAASLLLLTLPVDSPAVYQFCEKFLVWSIFQAVVMLVQNHYQRRRMYTRIALGKNSAMDVVAGESSGGSGQLLLLYPLLFALQASQVALGVHVAWLSLPAMRTLEGYLDPEHRASDLRGSRGIFVTGLAFAMLGIMNCHTTVATILAKRRYVSVRRTASRAALQQAVARAKVQ